MHVQFSHHASITWTDRNHEQVITFLDALKPALTVSAWEHGHVHLILEPAEDGGDGTTARLLMHTPHGDLEGVATRDNTAEAVRSALEDTREELLERVKDIIEQQQRRKRTDKPSPAAVMASASM